MRKTNKKLESKNENKNQNLINFLIKFFVVSLAFLTFGNILNKNVQKYLEQDFVNSRTNFANCVANSIDAKKHKEINYKKSIKDSDYLYYQNFLNKGIQSDEDISYLYTVFYDKEKDFITYTIDGETVQNDTIRVESEIVAFSVIVKDGKIILNYDDEEFDKKLEIIKNDYKIKIQVKNKSVIINDKKIFEILGTEPLILKPEGTSRTIEDNEVSEAINIPTNKGNLEFYLSFSHKGFPASNPGAMYVDDPEVLENIKSVILNGSNLVNYVDGAYGKVTTIFAPIVDENGNGNALVGIDYKQKNIDKKIGKILKSIKSSLITIYLVVLLILFINSEGKKYFDNFLSSFTKKHN